MRSALQSLAKEGWKRSDSCPQTHGEGGTHPGKRKTVEIKNSFSTRIRGSNHPAMPGAGDQESPVLGGNSFGIKEQTTISTQTS